MSVGAAHRMVIEATPGITCKCLPDSYAAHRRGGFAGYHLQVPIGSLRTAWLWRLHTVVLDNAIVIPLYFTLSLRICPLSDAR